MALVTAKFGGSSLADGDQFRKVRAIVEENPARRYVVPSAPGRRFPDDEKITDMLYQCQRMCQNGQDMTPLFQKITDRYLGIAHDLELPVDLESELDRISFAIREGQTPDYAASRGEYLCGLLLSAYLGFDFIDAAEVVCFDADGRFDPDKTQQVMSARLQKHEKAVIPGFYGADPNGKIKTFSRGGSDITGAIVARASSSCLYENWTDVDGFLMADPRIVHHPKPIATITYRELRELSYMGASVLHEEAIFPVRAASIPINIRNTNRPDSPGTMILAESKTDPSEDLITGIAGKCGILAITVEKNMMNSELGFGRRVLGALEQNGVSFEHLPTGIDTMTVMVTENNIKGKLDSVVQAIQRDCHPDHIEVISGLALIATVGRGMVRRPGVAARLFNALSDAGVNIRMIDQGSSEINIICGVQQEDFEKAMRAIYHHFVTE